MGALVWPVGRSAAAPRVCVCALCACDEGSMGPTIFLASWHVLPALALARALHTCAPAGGPAPARPG